MIESPPIPAAGGVACLAVCVEVCGDVIRVSGRRIYRLMAGNALAAGSLERLVRMARETARGDVRACQRECTGVVVEPLSPVECDHLMALFAVR